MFCFKRIVKNCGYFLDCVNWFTTKPFDCAQMAWQWAQTLDECQLSEFIHDKNLTWNLTMISDLSKIIEKLRFKLCHWSAHSQCTQEMFWTWALIQDTSLAHIGQSLIELVWNPATIFTWDFYLEWQEKLLDNFSLTTTLQARRDTGLVFIVLNWSFDDTIGIFKSLMHSCDSKTSTHNFHSLQWPHMCCLDKLFPPWALVDHTTTNQSFVDMKEGHCPMELMSQMRKKRPICH